LANERNFDNIAMHGTNVKKKIANSVTTHQLLHVLCIIALSSGSTKFYKTVAYSRHAEMCNIDVVDRVLHRQL